LRDSSAFFSIPTIITQVDAVVQFDEKRICSVPDGPMIVLICNDVTQMNLINEKILRNRTARSFINIDVNCQPPSFGTFLCIDDAAGFDLGSDEVELLCSMASPDYQSPPLLEKSVTTRVMFGNGVDISANTMQLLINGRVEHGRFNIIIGCNVGPERVMCYVPENKTQIIIGHSGPYTTMSYDDFLKSVLKKFSSE